MSSPTMWLVDAHAILAVKAMLTVHGLLTKELEHALTPQPLGAAYVLKAITLALLERDTEIAGLRAEIARLSADSPSCNECGQPMLPAGVEKRPNEYDHASGCPRAPNAPVREALERRRQARKRRDR